jgi:hypothetical protein
MEKLSKEYIIQKVEEHKDIIKDATDRLSDTLFKNRKLNNRLNLSEEATLEVRKILHEIVSELSMIGGFCDKWTQNYLDSTINILGITTAKSRINYVDVLQIEWWAMRINGIVVDYNKTPFRLSDLEPIFSVLKKALGTFGKSDKP